MGGYLWLKDPSFLNYEETIHTIQPTSLNEAQQAELRSAYRNKSTPELLLSFLIFKLCTFTPLVNVMPTVISTCETLHLTKPLFWVIKKTVFRQFCGGENEEEVIPVMQQLKQEHIGSILDFSIEADLKQDKPHYKKVNVDFRQESNHRADAVLETMKKSVDAAAAVPHNMVAVKVTAMGSPILLETISNIFNYVDNLFYSLAVDGRLDFGRFETVVKNLPGYSPKVMSEGDMKQLFERVDQDKDGFVDYIDFTRDVIPNCAKLTPLFMRSAERMLLSDDTHLPAALTMEDVSDMSLMLKRLEGLCLHAQQKKVKLMIDAEQSYFQPAIDHLALHLARVYNRQTDEPLVFNTYQLYMKKAYSKLRMGLLASQREQFHFGAKIVRGAYMVSERERARVCKIEDPIHDSIDDTHKAYNDAINLLLEAISVVTPGTPRVQFMVASHNNYSVKYTCRRMKELGLSPNSGDVSFGQLMGMKDFTTYNLAKDGFAVYKYIPYGPVENVIPYLLRRAQENNAVLGGNTEDVQRLWSELKLRARSVFT
jgi:proline dehydrogenase